MSLKWTTKKSLKYYARLNYRVEITEAISKDILVKLEGIKEKVSKEQISNLYEKVLIEKYPSKVERDCMISAIGLLDHEVIYMTYVPIYSIESRYEHLNKHIVKNVDKQKNEKFNKAEREKVLKSIGNAIDKVDVRLDKANEVSEQYLGADINSVVTKIKSLRRKK
jgi:peptide subunit release factor RF-3